MVRTIAVGLQATHGSVPSSLEDHERIPASGLSWLDEARNSHSGCFS